jgi:TRAP-type C4-dicarboxylate transport system permease small subunit
MQVKNKFVIVDAAVTKVIGWFVIIAEVTAAIMMLLLVADVISSKIFNVPVPSAAEFVTELNVILVFGTVAFVALERGHIRIDAFDPHLPKIANFILGLFSHILGILVCSYMSWRSFILVQEMLETKICNAGLIQFPFWPFALAVFLGFMFLTIAFILILCRTVIGGTEAKQYIRDQTINQDPERP